MCRGSQLRRSCHTRSILFLVCSYNVPIMLLQCLYIVSVVFLKCFYTGSKMVVHCFSAVSLMFLKWCYDASFVFRYCFFAASTLLLYVFVMCLYCFYMSHDLVTQYSHGACVLFVHRLSSGRIDPGTKKGLRDRNSPTCTLSQNGYGDSSILALLLALCQTS